MRVLFIAHMNVVTGATFALVNLVKGLSKYGVEIGIVCPKRTGELQECLKGYNIQYFSPKYAYGINWYPSGKTILHRIKSFFVERLKIEMAKPFVKDVIKSFRPDIVHCNTGACDIAYRACLDLNIPHVWHLREYQDLDFHFHVYPSMKALRKKILADGNFNIAITKGVFSHFTLRPYDKVVYDGIFPKDEIPVKAASFPFEYILNVGSFTEAKGLKQLLEAFVKVHSSYPSLHLLVAAKIFKDSSYYKYCCSFVAKHGLEDTVHFLDYRTDVYSLMKGAKALVVASPFEGFGFITAEGMYNNCVVIAHNTAGTKEQLDIGYEQTGHEIALRYNNQQELISCISAVMTQNFSDMTYLAKKVVNKNYTVENYSLQIYEYYQYILETKYGKKG